MDRTSPSNRHSTAAANPPGALSESFTLAAAGILGQFVVCRVSGEVGQMVGRVTPNSGDLRGRWRLWLSTRSHVQDNRAQRSATADVH